MRRTIVPAGAVYELAETSAALETLASQALRTIAVAYKPIKDTENPPLEKAESGLTFIGLLGISVSLIGLYATAIVLSACDARVSSAALVSASLSFVKISRFSSVSVCDERFINTSGAIPPKGLC